MENGKEINSSNEFTSFQIGNNLKISWLYLPISIILIWYIERYPMEMNTSSSGIPFFYFGDVGDMIFWWPFLQITFLNFSKNTSLFIILWLVNLFFLPIKHSNQSVNNLWFLIKFYILTLFIFQPVSFFISKFNPSIPTKSFGFPRYQYYTAFFWLLWLINLLLIIFLFIDFKRTQGKSKAMYIEKDESVSLYPAIENKTIQLNTKKQGYSIWIMYILLLMFSYAIYDSNFVYCSLYFQKGYSIAYDYQYYFYLICFFILSLLWVGLMPLSLIQNHGLKNMSLLTMVCTCSIQIIYLNLSQIFFFYDFILVMLVIQALSFLAIRKRYRRYRDKNTE